MFAVNLKGPLWFSQTVGKYFIKQNEGKIINISSEAGQEDLKDKVSILQPKQH